MPVITKYQMYKVLQLAQKLDVGTNNDPQAIFDARSSAINVWCTPEDHPNDQYWNKLKDQMFKGAFIKPADYVGGFSWNWTDDITSLQVTTIAYFITDKTKLTLKDAKNRPEDITWVMEKIQWLFKEAGVPCPELTVGDE